MDAVRFGELLRRWRVAAGLTQREAAAMIGVGQPTIAGYERGRAMPPLRRLQSFVDAYGAQAVTDLWLLPPGDLLAGVGTARSRRGDSDRDCRDDV